MSEPIDLSSRRSPVWYTVRVGHHWDDRLEVIIEDVADDARSRGSVNDTLQRISGLQGPADALHKELLSQINDLMGAKTGALEARKLEALADIVQAYEKARYP